MVKMQETAKKAKDASRITVPNYFLLLVAAIIVVAVLALLQQFVLVSVQNPSGKAVGGEYPGCPIGFPYLNVETCRCGDEGDYYSASYDYDTAGTADPETADPECPEDQSLDSSCLCQAETQESPQASPIPTGTPGKVCAGVTAEVYPYFPFVFKPSSSVTCGDKSTWSSTFRVAYTNTACTSDSECNGLTTTSVKGCCLAKESSFFH